MKGDCTRVGLLCPADGSSLGYPPSLIASCIFAATFGLSLVCHFALGFKHKTWVFMGVYCTGSLLEVLGYVGRILMRNNPYDLNTFLLQIICLTMAPAFYSAGLYLCLSRIVIAYGEGISRIKPITYTRFFIGCDIISLSLQGAGGGVAASSNSNSSLSLGNNLMLAGLIFQVVTLAIFGILCLDFAIRVNRNPSGKNPAYNTLRSSMRFQGFLFAVLVTFLTILTRSVYRIVELGGGWNNKLQREEIPFIILESVIITICVFAFAAFHPGFGFQNTFNTISKHPTVVDTGRKAALSMTPLQQGPANEHQTTEYNSSMGYSHVA